MRIGLVLEVITSFQNYKHGIEIRIWSVGQDNPQSWVRISYGTVKYVIDSNQNNTEMLADPHEDQAPQTNMKVIAARSTIPMHERKWIDIEPSEPTLAANDVSKKVISLLRHNQTVQREDDGAVSFWRIKFHLRNHSSQVQHWSDDRWKSCLASGGSSKRRYQYCSDNSGTILYLRALQGHSGHNLIDLMLQDNVMIESGIFHYIYHIWVDIDLAITKGLTFYQTRSNAIIFQGTLPAYCIPKVVRLKIGEVLYEKSYLSPRPTTKDLIETRSRLDQRD